jgi:4-hydroxy-tetrahydrodipicolinate synthase
MIRNARPFAGVFGYLMTPFREDGRIDVRYLAEQADRMIAAGIQGLAPLGNAGIVSYLSDEEREEVVEAVCRHVAGRVPILVGISATTTERSLHHAKFAERAGAAAVMAMPTSDWQLTDDETFAYFKQIGEALSIPVMAYDSKMKPGGLMPIDLVVRLAGIPNVSMMKDSSGDVERLQKLLDLTAGNLSIFVGKNTAAFPSLAIGCSGWCSSAPVLAPRHTVDLYRCVNAGDLAGARKIAKELSPLLDILVRCGLPRVLNAGSAILGKTAGPLRAPLMPLPASAEAQLRKCLLDLGLVGGSQP